MGQVLAVLRRLLPNLPSSARRFLLVFSLVSGVLSGIDVVALMLLALTLASAVTGSAVSLPVIGEISSTAVPWLIVTLAVVIVGKSAMSVWLQWIATRRFSTVELETGQRLLASYLRMPWADRSSRNSAQIVQLADSGIAQVVSGFLLPLTTLPGQIVTGVGVILVIVVAQPVTALVAIVYLGGIAALQYAVLGRKTRQAARVARDSALHVASLISGIVTALKEITLRGKTAEVEAVVATNRRRTAQARANVSFLSAVPRFVFDAAVIGGFVITGAVSFFIGGMEQAITAVALFGIAGFRLVPSLTGFQNVVTRTLTSTPYVERVIADIEEARDARRRPDFDTLGPLPGAPSELRMEKVSYTFAGSAQPAVEDVSTTIPIGTKVGVAGASGAGKSTLIDLMLGLLTPTSGEILIDGQSLETVLGDWRRHVGYVPQDVALFDGSIAQNIALTWGEEFDMDRVESAARRAQLWDVISAREAGLHTKIGERGMTLSGGQRQRLGIARALYMEPLVLVLDEATSALDTKTESDVTDAIRALHGDVTVIAVAHRLSTIKDSDQILFMQAGRVAASGNFEHVVRTNKEFAAQARLAGLA